MAKKGKSPKKHRADWRDPTSVSDAHMTEWREDGGNPYQNLLRNAQQLLFMRQFKNFDKPLRILDSGCAHGDLLLLFKSLDDGHDIYGVELIKSVAKRARERIGKGRVFTQSCEKKVPLPDNSVDLICSFDMIEHVPKRADVGSFFRECNRLLKKNGICVIVTPNISWFMRPIYLLTGNRYIIEPSCHPNQFTMSRLKREIAAEMCVLATAKGYDLNLFLKILSWFGIYRHLCVIATKKSSRKKGKR